VIRIGVISDTHGQFSFAKKVLEKWGKIDYLLHAGDGKSDALALAHLAKCPVWAVAGNTDGVLEPQDELIDFDGVKILLLHGYQLTPTNREERLAELAKRRKAQVVIYGHTHKPYFNYHQGVLVFNPGSPVRPRNSQPSCGLLEIDNKKISAKIIEIT
jgi:putative phosphoesterase